MKLKLTPLNIVSSICLVAAVLLLTAKQAAGHAGRMDITKMLAGIALLCSLVFFVSDLIFRRFVPRLGKLWLIEGVLVIFMVIIVFIIKSSIN